MKRWTVVVGLCAALLAATLGWADEVRALEGRPNFVIFVADDMSWDDCGPYGNPHVKTPNLDRLAREGMRFDRAFLTTASCSPSRASLVTGRYPHSTGAGELHMPLPAAQVLFTTPLRRAGYYTAAAGKWHLGPKSTQQLDRVIEGGGPSGSGDWMKLFRERPDGKPFLLWLAAIDPHRPYPRDKSAAPNVHDPALVVVPPYLPDTREVRADLVDYYDEIARIDTRIGEVLAALDEAKLAQNTVVMFLVDNGRPFPRAKTTLYDAGIRTPLLVRYPAVVKPRSTTGSLVSAVDLAPTIVELAGATAGETFQGRSFAKLLTDPTATVRDLTFAEHNWHDYRAAERAVRSSRFSYIRNYLPELTQSPPADVVRSPTYQQMLALHEEGKLRAAHARPFTVPRPAEELYDVEADPQSLNNLAYDPAHERTLADMRSALDAWRAETSDKFEPAALTPDRFDRRTGAPLKKPD